MFVVFVAILSLVSGVFAEVKKTQVTPEVNEFLEAIQKDAERIRNRTSIRVPRAECSECYGELDCFDMCKGILNHIRELPQTPDEISTQFTLYSRHNKTHGVEFTYQNVTPTASYLNAPRKLVILVHGFSSSSSASWMVELRERILDAEDVILITVDWSKGCVLSTGYARSVVNAQLVGRQIAVVLQKLIKISPRNVTAETTHFIGHSLGAQMGKFFSEYFKKLGAKSSIGRITALDAAAPLFEEYNICLNRTHAAFVDGIHTSAGDDVLRGKLGVTKQVGHVDLYINGGSDQPGCGPIDFRCSHKRAHMYYSEALQSKTCIFRSYTCVGGLKEYKEGKCQKKKEAHSAISFEGVHAMPGRGVGFVDTNDKPPFCKPLR